jgi:hypothetical protein
VFAVDKRGDRRAMVGTWRTRGNWEAWHHDPKFTETRQRLDGLESAPAEHWWHDVVLDVREAPPPTAKPPSKGTAKGKTKPHEGPSLTFGRRCWRWRIRALND